MIQFVTSMSDQYYQEAGKKMLTSYVEHWGYPIKVYYEDTKPDLEHECIDYVPLYDIPGVVTFLESCRTFPLMQGIVRPGGKMRYNYAIYRFARKIFAEIHAAMSTSADYLVWLDADVVINKPLDVELMLEAGFGDGDFMQYMFRPGYHGCSSFVAWDLKHEANELFWDAYASMLVSGQFLLLPEWHDIAIKEHLMKALKLPVHNLAEDMKMTTGPVNVFDMVFDGYAIHNKGKLKNTRGPRRYNQLMIEIHNRRPESVVEIGTWNGNRAIEMGKANPGMRYVGFDLFEDATAESDEYEKNVKAHNKVNDVAARLKTSGLSSVTLIKGDTNISLPSFTEKNRHSADLVFIDGGHAVDTIRSDLKQAMDLVKPDGVIILDDYYTDMPEEDLDKWGCNRVLEEMDIDYSVLPIADPVKGGGYTKMAIIELKGGA